MALTFSISSRTQGSSWKSLKPQTYKICSFYEAWRTQEDVFQLEGQFIWILEKKVFLHLVEFCQTAGFHMRWKFKFLFFTETSGHWSNRKIVFVWRHTWNSIQLHFTGNNAKKKEIKKCQKQTSQCRIVLSNMGRPFIPKQQQIHHCESFRPVRGGFTCVWCFSFGCRHLRVSATFSFWHGCNISAPIMSRDTAHGWKCALTSLPTCLTTHSPKLLILSWISGLASRCRWVYQTFGLCLELCKLCVGLAQQH